jgi:hypothetical protein
LHDVHALDMLLPEPGAIYVMDRGYVDFPRPHVLHQGDPLATAEVVRDLYRKPGKDEPSFSERHIYEAALDRLAGELAALDETDRAAAAAKIKNWLHGAGAPSPPSAV